MSLCECATGDQKDERGDKDNRKGGLQAWCSSSVVNLCYDLSFQGDRWVRSLSPKLLEMSRWKPEMKTDYYQPQKNLQILTTTTFEFGALVLTSTQKDREAELFRCISSAQLLEYAPPVCAELSFYE